MMERLHVEIANLSIAKHGEELCGDRVEIARNGCGVTVVLSDGLGSGVKANILATLTTTIAGSMLRGGAAIEDVVDTIGHTLPICKVRQVAYSTFTILQATLISAYLARPITGCLYVRWRGYGRVQRQIAKVVKRRMTRARRSVWCRIGPSAQDRRRAELVGSIRLTTYADHAESARRC